MSTEAGTASRLSSLTIAACVYWAIISPESTPGSSARNGGRPWLRALSRKRSVRRSLMLARSATAIARKSSTYPTGAPWKLPLDSTRPSSVTTGLSIAAASSRVRDQRGVGQRVPRGARDLGRAAQRVGVLHAGVLGAAVGSHERALLEQPPDVRGGVSLAGLRPQRLQVVGEHAVGAEQALDAHRDGDVGDRQQVAQVGDRQREHAEHPVGAVDQREALLLVEGDRRQHVAGLAQVAAGGAHRALPHQRQRAVRERREVAAAAERAVLVHDGRDLRVEHRRVGAGRLHPHAGPARGEGGEPQQHQRADHLALDLGAGARRVERIRLRWSWMRFSGGMCSVASAPKPVETP